MSTLGSNSTPAQIYAAYADNASYDLFGGDVGKAAVYVHACRLILAMPTLMQDGIDGQQQYDRRLVADQLKRAESWLAQRDTSQSGGSARILSMRNWSR